MPLNDEFLGAGWSYPLAVDGRGGIRLAHGEHDVAEAIYIILSTAPGERRMRPEFGCRIHELVFAPVEAGTLSLMRHYTIEALRRWEPRIELREVRVYRHPQADGTVLIDVDYVLRATNDERNLVYPFYRIPEHA